MTKREYAQAIAKEIGNAEVKEVEKANGVIKTGIMCSAPNGVNPVIYIDGMYKDGKSVEEATREVKSIMENAMGMEININALENYDTAKGILEARLYNKSTKADVKRSAKKYGYDDLIIVPYLNLGEGKASKVTKNMLDVWGVTATRVINQALRNMKGKCKIAELSEIIPTPMEAPFKVVITESKMFGAIAAIIMEKELSEMYPCGYTVIPSSIHEMLVLPVGDVSMKDLANMIVEVNKTFLMPEEILSDKAYDIVAVA